ncbi:NAD-dependent epimerase/dehydratase family protein [Cognataquiflexum rubidum]|uniref:NAD-dependent epimerase/dehydratase family protein n=1 Tax=Cognataquiflexum rubidum TaxID=2922273 RepID=UPI001F13E261|nr:NAD-dependent epimerase/dehydratase family protein [Cognataquiflexum rubidum]MCH6233839.1 NAD-dependent epimerase/dehydratase family protein [Cognataquiflexum rubidum]
MKILVTGATGLFGSYLSKKFMGEGEILALKRENRSKGLLDGSDVGITWVEGDILDPLSLEEAMENVDMVIHSAGMVSFNPGDEDELMKINVGGTANVVNAMLAKGVKKLIHVSSVSALGRTAEAKVSDENTPWIESKLNTPYAISKYQAELEVWRGVQEGLEALVVLPTIILGKISDDRSSTQIYHYVLEESKFYPAGTVNFIDIRDAVEITFQLFKKNLWNEKFILNHSAVLYKDFFYTMAKIFGKKAPSKKVSPFQIRLAIFFIGIGRLLGLTKNPLNRQTAMLSQLSITMDNQKVQQEIHFRYRTLEDSFRWAISNEK